MAVAPTKPWRLWHPPSRGGFPSHAGVLGERRLGVLLLLQLQPLLRRPEAARTLHDVALHALHLMRVRVGVRVRVEG